MIPTLNPSFDKDGGHTLFVYNIGSDANEGDMFDIFAQFGAVLKIDVIMNKETQKGKGFCFVTLKNHTDAKRAINTLDGARHPSLNSSKPLQVRFKDDDGKNTNQGGNDGLSTTAYDPYADIDGHVPKNNVPSLMEQQCPNSMEMFDDYAGFTDDPYMNPLAAMRRPLPMGSARPLQSMMPTLNTSFDSGGGHILFVYNIGSDANENDMYEIFAQFGAVLKIDVIMNKETKKGKGFCFVTLKNHTDAKRAINTLDGARHPSLNSSKPLQVRFKDDDGKNTNQGGSDGFSSGAGAHDPYADIGGRVTSENVVPGLMEQRCSNSRPSPMSAVKSLPSLMPTFKPNFDNGGGHILFVYNIGSDANEDDMFNIFAQYGAVLKIDVIMNKETQKGKGFCFVTMKNHTDAKRAINALDGARHPSLQSSKPLQVRFKDDDEAKNTNQGGSNGFSTDAFDPYADIGSSVLSKNAVPDLMKQQYPKSRDMFDNIANFSDDPYMSPNADTYQSSAMRRPLPMGSARPLQSMMPTMNPSFDNDGGHILFVYNIGSDTGENDMLQIFSQFGAVLKIDVIMNKETQKGKGFCFVTMKYQTDAKRAINALDGTRHPYLNSSKPLQVRFKDDDGKNANKGGSDECIAGAYDPYADIGGTVPSKNPVPGLMEQQNFASYDSYSRDIDNGLSGPIRNGRSLAMKNRFNPLTGREMPSMADKTVSDGHIIFVYNINPKSDEGFLYELFSPFGSVTKVDIIKNENGEGKGYGFVTMNDYDEALDSIEKLDGLCHESNPTKALQVKFKTSKK